MIGSRANYIKDFCTRTRAAREARNMTQAAMARALGISAEAYRKNESRSPLPHCLIERFVAITGTDLGTLFAIPTTFRRQSKTL